LNVLECNACSIKIHPLYSLHKRLHKGCTSHFCLALQWLSHTIGWIGYQHLKLRFCQGFEALGELGHRPVDATGLGTYECIPTPDDLINIHFLLLMPLPNLPLRLPQQVFHAPPPLIIIAWIHKYWLAHLWLGLGKVVTQWLVSFVSLFPRVPPMAYSVFGRGGQTHYVCTSTRQRRRCRC